MAAPEIENPKTPHDQPPPGRSALRAGEQRRLRVLVAETDARARVRLVGLLAEDCQVVCAETVRRAMRFTQHVHFDLVICDSRQAAGWRCSIT
ncbi:MAG TPA: hypothetical protein VFD58_17210 [Blastocatellia bacterium]|nr:hypothetical protein [Blastocatellia bacterium]